VVKENMLQQLSMTLRSLVAVAVAVLVSVVAGFQRVMVMAVAH
jgi:hypothetical protein